MIKIYLNSTLVFFVAPSDAKGVRSIVTAIKRTGRWKTVFVSREVGMCGIPITNPRVINCDSALLEPHAADLTASGYTVVSDGDRSSSFQLLNTIAVVAPLSEAGLRRVRKAMGIPTPAKQTNTRAFLREVRALIEAEKAKW